jgi:hypothetical protein
MSVVFAPAPARRGYRVVDGSAVLAALDLDAAARLMADSRGSGRRFEVTARVTWTRERPLTEAEARGLLVRAAALVEMDSRRP